MKDPRVLGAALTGGLVGLGVLTLSLTAGILLYNRLGIGSSSVLVAICIGFGVVGAYAGWLLGVLVFSFARGQDE